MAKKNLRYVETEGGPFVLLPIELKKSWKGQPDDYERATSIGSGVGVLDVGRGQALILGQVDVTAFLPRDDGGVFIQRVYGDDDAAVIALVEKTLKKSDWKTAPFDFDAGKGTLALFDSAYKYDDSDEDERLQVVLPAGKYALSKTTAKAKDIELGLVRLSRIATR